MYYPDLSPYNYFHYCEKELNVGWLQEDQKFSIGTVSIEFLEKLKTYDEKSFRIHRTKGFHKCKFCSDKNTYGSYEIRIVSKEGKIFACPNLVIHYIEEHNYLPPPEFINAVINGPLVGSKEYNDIIKLLPTFWEQKKPDVNEIGHEEKRRQIIVDSLTESVDKKILDELVEKNPEMKKFIEKYNQIMPSVYGIEKKYNEDKK